MSWPRNVVVATPTVPRRVAPWKTTLAQWRNLGTTPAVYTQPEEWPLSHTSHKAAVDILLRRILNTHPGLTHILLAEDDIDLDPALPTLLPGLADDRVVSLCVNGTRFYPTWIKGLISEGAELPRTVVPITDQHSWWGTQAVLLPREVVVAALGHTSGQAGWDVHLRHWAKATRTRIHTAVPNLVQHRGVPSLASVRGGGLGRSATYLWPTEEEPR